MKPWYTVLSYLFSSNDDQIQILTCIRKSHNYLRRYNPYRYARGSPSGSILQQLVIETEVEIRIAFYISIFEMLMLSLLAERHESCKQMLVVKRCYSN